MEQFAIGLQMSGAFWTVERYEDGTYTLWTYSTATESWASADYEPGADSFEVVQSQAVFVCKNPDCGWSGNADWNAARNVLHLYRTGHALIPAAGRAVVRRARRVKPAAAR